MSEFVTYNVVGCIIATIIPNAVKYIGNEFMNKFFTKVIVKKNSLYYYSLLKYFNINIKSSHVIFDGNILLVYGKYFINYILEDNRSVNLNINYSEESIEFLIYITFFDFINLQVESVHNLNKELIINFIKEIHNLLMNPERVNVQHIMKDNGFWSDPIIRDHRNIINLTPEMKSVKKCISKFLQEDRKEEYRKRGIPYRYGILLCGNSGTGKTTMAEYISQRYCMNMYCINLISKNLTDSILQQSLVTIDKNSLIVIDEFDKVYPLLIHEKTHITFSGILSSIDGAIRLSEGCIVIMMMNNCKMKKSHKSALIRKGRLDSSFEFTTQYSP